MSNGLQLRSATFQLIKVYFDEEVSSDKIDKFRQLILKLRYPQSVLEFFCFATSSAKYLNLNNSGQTSNTIQMAPSNPIQRDAASNTIKAKGDKAHSSDAFKHFAKNTLRKAGLMPRNNNRKVPQQIQGVRTPETARKLLRNNSSNVSNNSSSIDFESSAIYNNSLSSQNKNSLQMDSDCEAESLSGIFNLHKLVRLD